MVKIERPCKAVVLGSIAYFCLVALTEAETIGRIRNLAARWSGRNKSESDEIKNSSKLLLTNRIDFDMISILR